MVLSGLFAALGHGDGQTWGWYAIAAVGLLVTVYQIAQKGTRASANKDQKTKRFFSLIGSFILVVWSVYPV
jgi:bacteriorhodopsin